MARQVLNNLEQGLSFRDKLNDNFAELYGRVLTATTAAELTAAIATAKAGGQATTILISGTLDIASTVVVDASNITLQGAGGDTSHDVGTQGAQARATLNWTGVPGGTVVQFTSVPGGSNQCLSGGGMRDIYVGCGGSAAIGLQVLSWRKGTFENLHFDNPTTVAVDLNVVAALGEARDVQNCVFDRISSRHSEVSGGTGGVLRMGGDSTANVSLCYFEQIDCKFVDGTAYLFNNMDNNFFLRLRAFRDPGGAGSAIVFNGSDIDVSNTARSNIIVHFTTNGPLPIIMRGTSSFTHPSTDNSVMFLDFDNGYAVPTFEAGATGQWSDTRGLHARLVQIGAAIGDDVTNALAAKGRLGSASVHIVNGSQDHVALSDASGANGWGLSIDGSGDLRIVRHAGAGNFNLPTTLAYNGAAVTLGAPDSAGTGFRALRVPNA